MRSLSGSTVPVRVARDLAALFGVRPDQLNLPCPGETPTLAQFVAERHDRPPRDRSLPGGLAGVLALYRSISATSVLSRFTRTGFALALQHGSHIGYRRVVLS
jgi:hypothetical protein